MPRPLYKLTAVAVKNAPPGKYSDGGGLWLHKREDGGAQWILRVNVHGRRREMGLGSVSEVSLKEAREAAERWRSLVRGGLDPIKERQRQRREAARNLHCLDDIARDAFESRKAELKGDGVAGRWFSPLEIHVLPRLGKVPVVDIDQTDIRDVLAPIWHSKAETARKALNRLAICLKHAAALGLSVDLQATDKARALLGKQRHKPENIPAMPWRDVPIFYASLSDGTVTHLALRLLILTGVRSAPLRFLREEQINGDVWTIPGEAMKGRRGATADFRVPLSDAALEVIEQARRHAREGFLFPSVKKGVISDATMSRLMERAGMAARPHGFRSSLRDWIAEVTEASHDVAETTLGHIIGGAVERAYRRTDFLEQRRALMVRWARHVTGQRGQVIALGKRSRNDA
ncbi:tyrosine-type recombinase/integrase [Sinorhizobium meliloti]|uniref:Integrase n=1 Tax=Rhizobium meliloti (strain 1021) TaxID=266834 RepID=Q92SB7_RHIME|nr:site-specific integrase [Sinorhizobium meliloti]AGG73072.1 Integrase [Sinorhizobium meliloti 2011]ASP57821.1 integrase [Sinorhizobium meliloti]MCK3802809.1 integrase arm-type DNA-binding domain-containing protein [Sinorhizobium meliloti]MCK3808671.1 integrase arm-type DNA-binding domain-containing protein [Sinorhizobium meliloti]MCK3813440.1 integrase arm-type DNA-binding domain-containing protein [Sinorhizobium meliloti]